MRWVCAAAVAVLWPQLVLFGGVGARREHKRPRPPGPRPESPSTTVSSSGSPRGSSPKPSEASAPEFSAAHATWLSFVRRPNDVVSKKRCRGHDKKTRGISGSPGAVASEDVLLQEFQRLLREATERRFSGLLGPWESEGPTRRLVEEAFHCRLRGPLQVAKRTLAELHGFQAPTSQGSFLRGSGLSLASGRFTAPVAAIFQFSASLHVDPRELQGRARLRTRDTVRVLICIESLCHHHTSLEAISGLESSGRAFTVHVQGLLQLQAGQYASVFVDNGSGAALTIHSGSSFSGLLLGM